MNNNDLYKTVYPCYIESEINRIQEHNKPLQAEGHNATIQICFDGEKTKHISITPQQLAKIKLLLTKCNSLTS